MIFGKGRRLLTPLREKMLDKELLEQSIKDIEESIQVSRDNKKKAEHHIAEGEVILEAFKQELERFK